MNRWTSRQVARVLGLANVPEMEFRSVQTDSRSLEPGSLFVALVGDRFDGHDFLLQARQAGATGAVVRHGTPPVAGLQMFEVDDPLAALGELAHDRRSEITGPVVAVTGTNGKTSVKEMLASALSTRWEVHATRANLNNLVGVPLTILTAPPTCQALVVEAGASEPGEIGRLRSIVEPTLAVITNVAQGHLSGFGSLEGVMQEKLALAEGVPLAVVGTDPPALARQARRIADRVIVAGFGADADVRPDRAGLDGGGRGWLTLGNTRIELPLLGRHQLYNAMLALAVAQELALDMAAVAGSLRTVSLPPGRCEVVKVGDMVIIQDTYNANPGSLRALLETATGLRQDRPLVVMLGTMLELGRDSAALHAAMADAVLAAEPHLIAALGEFAAAFERHRARLGDRLLLGEDPDTLGRALAQRLKGNELVLVKGSRGVRMERAIPHLLEDEEAHCSTTS
ncbi:MAG: UDP-N-acetylmuramoyl-tripeptide--D-alanyl-D-alanine ligase [Gemmatimonadota bacterium]|nr:MAG: UDP-N-acetylmuramoyl-tripeptide--D-alanyl-D-alanine ligase [Gemmatimonadota bacterium]